MTASDAFPGRGLRTAARTAALVAAALTWTGCGSASESPPSDVPSRPERTPVEEPAQPVSLSGPLTVTVKQAESGDDLTGPARCALVRGADSTLYARFPGGRYDGSATPAAGDDLFVFVEGHDLGHVRLERTGGDVAVALVPSRDTCVVTVPEVARGADLHALHRGWVPGDYVAGEGFMQGELPLVMERLHEVDGAELELSIPRGMECAVKFTCENAVVWPVYPYARPGGRIDLGAEALRTVTFTAARPVRSGSLVVIPDRSGVLPPPLERGDALNAFFRKPRWWRAVGTGDGVSVERVPRSVGVHAFGVAGKRLAYGYSAAARTAGALALVEYFRVPSDRVRVSGQPLPRDTLVFPGHLDLLAVATIREQWSERAEELFRAAAGDDDLELPAGDATFALPDGRIVHHRLRAPPPGGDVLEMAPAPGQIAVDLGEDARGRVQVRLWPTWEGAGHVYSQPSTQYLTRSFRDASEVRLTGLPIGRYDVQVLVVDEDGALHGDPHRRSGSVTLRETSPSAVLRPRR